MTTLKKFWNTYVAEPPILFPMISLGHLLFLLWCIKDFIVEPHGPVQYVNVLWMLAYTTFWLGANAMKKWAAIGYIITTIINIMVYFAIDDILTKNGYVSSIFLIDAVLSFGLLWYFKQMK